MTSFIRWADINDILEWGDAEALTDDNHFAVREKVIRKLLALQDSMVNDAELKVKTEMRHDIFDKLKNAGPLMVSRDAFDESLTCNITPYIIERYEEVMLK